MYIEADICHNEQSAVVITLQGSVSAFGFNLAQVHCARDPESEVSEYPVPPKA
jgi:hypothetical protein